MKANRRSSSARSTKAKPASKPRRWLSRGLSLLIISELIILAWLVGGFVWRQYGQHHKQPAPLSQVKQSSSNANAPGHIVDVETPTQLSATATLALIRQTDKAFNLPVSSGITKQVFRYHSTDARDGSAINVYGRVYIPTGATDTSKLPVLVFAPGTTGIADTCAASLEQPAKRNWANYDSLLAAYVSQGYVVVTTDYEGMRDDSRLHHYMVGEQEGRAVLDSARALEQLKLSRDVINKDKIALAGYSQGGHAVLWADQIRAQYAPDIKIRGVVGFGPVTSVKTTLDDVSHGANISWFGPYVLLSYADYYNRNYPVDQILLPNYAQKLKQDVLRSCIDTVHQVWVGQPNAIYTPTFLDIMRSGYYTGSVAQFGADLERNNVGISPTPSAKLINQGGLDNVILPSQSAEFVADLCRNSKTTTYQIYKGATHYNTMITSFPNTLSWLNQVYNGQAPTNCAST